MTSWLVVAAVLVSPPPTSSPLTGCEAAALRHGWEYTCPEELSVRVVETWASREEVAKGIDDLADKLLAEGLATRRNRSNPMLGGRAAYVVELTGARGTQIHAQIVEVPGSRILYCFSPGEATRCTRVLEFLAQQEWGAGAAAGATVIEQTIAVAGHPLTPPRGCHVRQDEESGSIQCEPTDPGTPGWTVHSSATWVLLPDQKSAKELVSAKRKIFAEGFRPDAPRAEEEDVPCRLAGRKTVCRVQTHSKERLRKYFEDRGMQTDGETLGGMPLRTRMLMTAVVRVEGKLLVAWCLSDGSSGEGVPCSSFFEVSARRP